VPIFQVDGIRKSGSSASTLPLPSMIMACSASGMSRPLKPPMIDCAFEVTVAMRTPSFE
jgi:hypothetical protein